MSKHLRGTIHASASYGFLWPGAGRVSALLLCKPCKQCKRTRKKTSFKSNEWQVLTRARLIHGFYHSSSLNLLYLLQSLFYILRNQVLLWFKRNVKIFHGKRNPEYSEEELKSYVKVLILFK